MTVFHVTQPIYGEGNFGDLELVDLKNIGIYSTRELAEKAAALIVPNTYHAQFGSGEEKCIITELELDVMPVAEPVYHCKECNSVMRHEQPYCSHSCWHEATQN